MNRKKKRIKAPPPLERHQIYIKQSIKKIFADYRLYNSKIDIYT